MSQKKTLITTINEQQVGGKIHKSLILTRHAVASGFILFFIIHRIEYHNVDVLSRAIFV